MEHWPRIARHWALLGPPLRPSAEDLAVVAALIAEVRPSRTVVLGATPELAELAPVLAIDRERAMHAAILPRRPGRSPVVGDWLALPCAGASADMILGDGCLANLRFPDQYRALAAELARVIRPGGRVVLRSFVSPDVRESLDDVRLALPSIEGFHALKWRIAHAIAPASRNVRVSDIWRAFADLVPDRSALRWSRPVVDTIDVYRESTAVYSFPTAGELRAAMAGSLVDVACHIPGYELGERCPSIIWRRP